ncbi:MAG: tricorn protease [Blastocatellia bacterium]
MTNHQMLMNKLKQSFACALMLILALMPLTKFALVAGQEKPFARSEALPYFTDPAISPDGSEIAFVSASDLWTVPASGGTAQLLVAHPAVESHPLYSPDGNYLAFVSTRTGNGDIYILDLKTGALRQLTFDDGYDQLNAWSRDGQWIYFSSTSLDIGGMSDLYRVSSAGGTPMPVSAEPYVNEYFCAPSPDGRSLAFTARGIAASQWWRKGHSHIDECEIWLLHDGPPATYEQVTGGNAKELWPMWSADGRSLFYVSDASGAQNIWRRPLKGQARQVTRFQDGRVLWPTISLDGRTIVFERDFAIWKLNTESGQVSKLPISRFTVLTNNAIEHRTLTGQIQEFQLSPDGKKIAFAVRGEIFAVSAREGGDALRVTHSEASEFQLAWAPDSNRLVYVCDRGTGLRLYLYDFRTNQEAPLTSGASDYAPRFSPDGKRLAFVREGREIRSLDMDSRKETLITQAQLERPPFVSDRALVWSPDSQWLSYVGVGQNLFKNVYVVPASGGRSQPVSFLTNYGSNTLSWSPDGTFILFDTGQRNEDSKIARINLKLRMPTFREDQFRDLFKDGPSKPAPAAAPRPEIQPAAKGVSAESPAVAGAAAAEPKNAEPKNTDTAQAAIVFDGIRQRLNLLSVGLDVASQTISPDGKSVLISANAAGQQNLYLYPLNDPAAVARQLTSTPGGKRGAQFSADGKEVYYLDQGRLNVVPLDNRPARPLVVAAEMDVDFEEEKVQVFSQAWTYLRDHFFDANFNGVNWEAVRSTYTPYIAGASTADELRRLLQLMLGELNASHLGITALQTNVSAAGKLGLQFDRREYESRGLLKITEVLPYGAAAMTLAMKPGDYLLAVDGETITARTNLDELLYYKIGKRVVLTVAATDRGANQRELVVQPMNAAAVRAERYGQWVEDNRAYVSRLSGGRLGYVHMMDMSQTSLAQLALDLDAENYAREGVIIDLRNNSGGSVNVQVIDMFARREYFMMTPRGLPTAPARTVLGQRALEAPTILLVNQHTISDAEEFTEGYRFLKLGKVVGEPTAGWVIYTQRTQLIDGSFLRIPNTKITARDGTPMEMHPRPVDMSVSRPLGEGTTGRDTQLDTAVQELLKQLGNRERSTR